MKQVTQHSGSLFHFNLDPASAKSMHEAVEQFSSSGTPVSLSVLVRRALRVYRRHLNGLQTDAARKDEEREVLRAGRGL
jgi:hypothetical protein